MPVRLRLPRPHPAQKKILKSRSRFILAVCGRRFGKTEIAKQIVIREALAGKSVWWLSPIYTQSSAVWRSIKFFLKNIPHVDISESERRIVLPTGGTIEVKSAHAPDSLRGAGLDIAVMDECAFMRQEVWHEIVRPMLADTQGRAIFLTTPNGTNWFYNLYLESLQDAEWEVFQFPTHLNPRIPLSELESIERVTPPAVYEQEYLAQFISAENSVFALKETTLYKLPSSDGETQEDAITVDTGVFYVAGLDFGQSTDYTAISVIDATNMREVALHRWRQQSWSLIRARIAQVMKEWHVEKLVAERNSIGTVNIEALMTEFDDQNIDTTIQPFTTTARSKDHLVKLTQQAIADDDLKFLDIDYATAELRGFATTQTAMGVWQYSAPSGGHDDTVMARMLAVHGAIGGGLLVRF